MAKKNEQAIELQEVHVERAVITIEGSGDLVLNKMNDPTARALTDIRNDKAKSLEKPDPWESVMTSLHWRDGKPTDFSEEGFKKALKENAPCITAFGLKKAILAAVVRNGIDTYSTKMDSALNIIASAGLIPITFSEHYIDEKLMSPQRGKPVLVKLNRFAGWAAKFVIEYTENVYSIEQIVNVINLAGFGGGVGSGRSSGYGRFKVTNIESA